MRVELGYTYPVGSDAKRKVLTDMAMIHCKHSWLEGNDELEKLIRRDIGGICGIRGDLIPRTLDISAFKDLEDWGEWECRDWWCSFDRDSGNFHIVPLPEEKNGRGGKLEDLLEDSLKRICGKLEMIAGLPLADKKPQHGKPEWARCHYWLAFRTERDPGYEYLASFNRMVCSRNGVVSNHLGKAQFMRYRAFGEGDRSPDGEVLNEGKAKAATNINRDSSLRFKMMYPATADDRDITYNTVTGHCVFNAPYSIAFEDPGAVAESLAAFLDLFAHLRDPDRKAVERFASEA